MPCSRRHPTERRHERAARVAAVVSDRAPATHAPGVAAEHRDQRAPRHRRDAPHLAGAAVPWPWPGVIQTVPSLALLAAMVPVLAALDLQSIGFLPAIVGLTLYGVLPVLRNTVTGIAGVDPALREAARGVGMTSRQQLLLVELPLAMPVIVAGIRTATVWGRRHCDAVDPGRRDQPRQLHLQRAADAQLRRDPPGVRGRGRAGPAAGRAGGGRSRSASPGASGGRLTTALAAVGLLYAYAGITFAAPLLG